MKEGLSIKFNHKSKKEAPKTEDGIKVGTRRDHLGNTLFVRGGKIISETKHDKEKLNEFRSAAAEATAKQNKAAQEHHKPRGAKSTLTL
ncbi:MAG: hypothetical protein PSY14_12985 [bacterium]|nr:hypothetical protein [bacterium]